MTSFDHRLAGIRMGETLGPLAVPVSASLVVASSIASRDFHRLHHDCEFAREQGHAHMFLSGLVSCGLAQRFVTDWAGCLVRVRRIRTRLGLPQYADETLELKGVVTACAQDSNPWIEITVTGTNGRGQHLQSIIELEPRAAPAPSGERL
jgi:acyl dehydratase